MHAVEACFLLTQNLKQMAKYSKGAGAKVEDAMHEMKAGKLKSGSGKKVTSRSQAIAIGLSEAREAGEKVPRQKGAAKSSNAPAKRAAPKKAAAKKATAKKTTAKKTTAKKTTAKKSTAKATTKKAAGKTAKKSAAKSGRSSSNAS
jgi:hypothetical protein